MSTFSVEQLRQLDAHIVTIGSHRGIIQSILDFDFLSGRAHPSVGAIIASGRKTERYFYGRGEVTIPVYSETHQLPERTRNQTNLLLNLSSGRRVMSSSMRAMYDLPNLVGEVVFAEGLPERHALELAQAATKAGVWIIGGSSVGLVLPGRFKLGAIGGVQARQIELSKLFLPGKVAVISSSGGMVNEIIRTVAQVGQSVSFAMAIGGERFPMVSPLDAALAAQQDPNTEAIVYFGELGGRDEYLLVQAIRDKKITKPLICYVAGTVAELFDTPPQFGHAKAIAARDDETARAKSLALREVGAQAADTYSEFVMMIRQIPAASPGAAPAHNADHLTARKSGLIASSISGDTVDGFQILGTDLLVLAENNSFAAITVSMFLGHKIRSREMEQFVEFVLRLLVDHGPYVSGAVNTIVAARAGRDLVSSLASGLLTIGPRFGGALNEAAATMLRAVRSGVSPAGLVEEMAARKAYIAGIGHRKYRSDLPDPRVAKLLSFGDGLEQRRFITYALGIEAETVRKKGNLILNVDGTIAAVLLDILSEKEGYSDEQLENLVATEFFNALFVLSRSVGFMSHYFDQLRIDEGIFRLNPNQVAHIAHPDRGESPE